MRSYLICKYYPVVIILFFSNISTLYAQSSPVFSISGNNPFEIRFRQDNRTFIWNGILAHQFQVGDNWLISFNDNLSSTMVERSENDQWRDNHNFLGTLNRSFSEYISGEIKIGSSTISDKQSGFVNDKATHSVELNTTYRPRTAISVKPIIGYKNEQLQKNTQGMIYGFDTRINNYQWNGYQNHLHMFLSNENLDERKNRGFSLNVSTQKDFAKDTGDSLAVIVTRKQISYYTQNYSTLVNADDNFSPSFALTVRKEQNTGISNKFYYPLSSQTRFGVTTSLNNTLIDLDILANEISQTTKNQRIANYFWLSYQNEWLSANTSFFIEQQTHRFLAEQNNITSGIPYRRSDYQEHNRKMALTIDTKISEKDQLHFSGFVNLLRYDTPNDNNDDKDVFRSRFALQQTHKFNPALWLRSEISTDFSHLVFLFSERSTDNRWSRIFRLSPEIRYQPSSSFRTTNRFSILANYTDYDFELTTKTRSFAFRQFSLSDSSSVQIMPHLKLDLYYQFKQSDVGHLDWDGWIQDVTTKRDETSTSLSFSYAYKKDIQFSPGVNFYHRHEARERLAGNEERIENLTIQSTAPFIRLNYKMSNGFVLDFYGEHRLVTDRDKKYTVNTIHIHLN